MSTTHSRADEWRPSGYESHVFVASIRNGTLAGIDVECRPTDYGRAEVTVDLRLPVKLHATATQTLALIFRTDHASAPVNMRRLGTDLDMEIYRWTAWDKDDHEAARSLGEMVSQSKTLTIADAATGTTTAFSFDFMTADRLCETIRRCGKEAMRVRDRASRMTDSNAVIALEEDANDRCRGGSGDSRETWNACDERTEYFERLRALNWCFGKIGQSEAQKVWHRCAADSIR